MQLVILVAILALIEFMVFSALVGWARGRYNCPAPATTGDPVFERYYRVHQNTLEQLAVFLPALFFYATLGNANVAALVGLVFIVGRVIYALAYVRNPAKRGPGFLIGYLANIYLLFGSLVLAVRSLL